jgi:hypothetical protein
LARQDTKLESEGAEFIVLGLLLIEGRIAEVVGHGYPRNTYGGSADRQRLTRLRKYD